jgi:hypothetical protein
MWHPSGHADVSRRSGWGALNAGARSKPGHLRGNGEGVRVHRVGRDAGRRSRTWRGDHSAARDGANRPAQVLALLGGLFGRPAYAHGVASWVRRVRRAPAARERVGRRVVGSHGDLQDPSAANTWSGRIPSVVKASRPPFLSTLVFVVRPTFPRSEPLARSLGATAALKPAMKLFESFCATVALSMSLSSDHKAGGIIVS